jgi:Protein of unknown function (DUF2442)
MILRIREARVCGPHSLRLTFNDGTSKQVDVRPLLDGTIFEPLRDPVYFATMALDSICGTVVWPNGADFAPEALHELEAQATSESAPRTELGRGAGNGSERFLVPTYPNDAL